MKLLPFHVLEALKQGHVVYHVSPEEAVMLYPYHELVLEVPFNFNEGEYRDSMKNTNLI